MTRFKQLTEGDGFNAVIMGRKTWDSLPTYPEPLPNRASIVVTKNNNSFHQSLVGDVQKDATKL